MRADQARVSNLDVVSFINMYVCVAIASLPVLLHVVLSIRKYRKYTIPVNFSVPVFCTFILALISGFIAQ